MTKKLIMLLLSAALIIANGACVLAQSVELNVTMNVFTVNVWGKLSDSAGRISVQMLSEDQSKLLYNGETDVINSEFTFQPFSVSEDTLTGTYIVRVGGKNIPITEKKVNFVNKNDRKNAIIAINDASMDTIKDVLTLKSAILDLDISKYLSLRDPWQSRINAILAALDLSINAEASNVIEKQQLLQSEYNKNIEMAALCDQTDSVKLSAQIDTIAYTPLDKNKFYAQLKAQSVDSFALNKFIAYDFEQHEGIDKALISNVFDGSVLLGILSAMDWGTVEEAINYYENKKLFVLNHSSFHQLSSNDKASVYKDLKKINFNYYTEIPASFQSISETYLKRAGQGGNGGGGGGKSGGSSVVSGGVTTGVIQTPPPVAPSFSDMESSAWAMESVSYLSARGVISGRGDGKFYPNESVTREEFVKMIVMAFDLLDHDALAKFTDVDTNDWFYPYVASAKKAGIITGVNENQFGVGEKILRQDMAVIMMRIYALSGNTNAIAPGSDFLDASEISDYAKAAVGTLYGAGIIGGTGNGKFSPNEPVSRAQSAKIAYELLKYIGGVA